VTIAVLLYNIVKKNILFEWGPVQQQAQKDLKELIEECFYTRNPKFSSKQPLVLAVDSLWRAIGYYIYQRDNDDPE